MTLPRKQFIYDILARMIAKATVQIFLHLNPLNAELNPICHLLALLGAHHILHISGVRVKLLPNSRVTWLKNSFENT